MSAPAALYLPARAKLNLVLRIVGRRADGYHLLDTVFHTLDLHDDVIVRRCEGPDGIQVSADREGLLVPADASNLAMRALQAWRDRCGARAGAHGLQIHIHKRIPNGGGLGGGSSNAAAVLRLANRHAGDPLDLADLMEIATPLGADVPFFVRGGGSQRGRGIGDQLQELQVAPRHFVLIVPPYGCNTAEVYKNHAALWPDAVKPDTLPSITVVENRDSAVGIRYCNDLEPAAERVQPELVRLRAAVLSALDATTVDAAMHERLCMSGSGSTLFVGCDDAAAARRCAEALRERFRAGEHRDAFVLVTPSGPPFDGDQPSDSVPHLRPRMWMQ